MSTRVLITGMGGELGTRVAQLIEGRSWADDVMGVDFVPPRRRLRRAEFRRIDPRDRDRLAAFVQDYAPTVVAHFGVYEPASRMTPASAYERTELATIATLSAAARAGSLEYVVVAGSRSTDRAAGASRCPMKTSCPCRAPDTAGA